MDGECYSLLHYICQAYHERDIVVLVFKGISQTSLEDYLIFENEQLVQSLDSHDWPQLHPEDCKSSSDNSDLHRNNAKIHLRTINLDRCLASAVSTMCRRSTKFITSFIQYTKYHRLKWKLACCTNFSTKCSRCSWRSGLKQKIVFISILMVYPRKYWLDYLWNDRMQTLVRKKMMLADTMAWLSTLGGGYSALGDYFTYHAKIAGEISLQQLKIAVELGDPGTAIRCKLYYAQSIMQQGHLRRAKYTIRHLYKNDALVQCPQDFQLHEICRGLWSRLRYYYANKQSVAGTTRHS